jgi:hypothetical protein
MAASRRQERRRFFIDFEEEETMDWSILTVSRITRAAALAGLTVALVVTSATSGAAQRQTSAPGGRTLEGAWVVQVTLRNCATNAALGSFNSLVTFARGGTLSESPGSVAFAPGQRSPGHGKWAHDGGNTYSQRVVALILFDTAPNPPVSPGFLKGWQVITHTVVLSDRDHFTSSGGAEYYDADGVLYRSGCSTAIGQRFE